MKKAVLVILFFGLLFATEFDTALKEYKLKHYKNSYMLFKKLMQQNYTSMDYNFFFGMSAVKLGYYNEAIAAFERILMYNPDNKRVKLELAKAYFLKKEYKRAKDIFTEVLKEVKNVNVKKHIKRYLKLIDEKEKKDFLTVVLSVGYGYETNINSSSDNDTFLVYNNILNTYIDMNNTTPKEDSGSLEEMALFNYKHIGEKTYTHSFLIYNKNVFKDSSKNITLFKYTPKIDFGKYRLLLGLTHLRYGGKNYLQKYEIGFDKNNIMLNTGYKKYLQSINENKDAKFIKAGYKYVNKKSKYKYGIDTYVYMQRKIKGDLPTVDYNEYYVKGYLKYKKAKPFLSLTVDDYLKQNSAFNKAQYDKKITAGVVFTNPYKRKYIFQYGVKYVKNFSNIGVYEYHKYMAFFKILAPLKF